MENRDADEVRDFWNRLAAEWHVQIGVAYERTTPGVRLEANQ